MNEPMLLNLNITEMPAYQNIYVYTMSWRQYNLANIYKIIAKLQCIPGKDSRLRTNKPALYVNEVK